MRRRWAGLGLAAVLLCAVAACSGAPTPGASASPQNGIPVLTAAAAKTHGQSYQFAITYGSALTAEGVTSGDGTATSAKITFADAASGVVVKIDAIVLPKDVYARVDLGAAAGALVGISPDTWLHVDPAKAPGAARLGITPGKDLFGPDNYVKAVTSATVVTDTQISGTLDLTKTSLPGLAVTEIANVPASSSLVPFIATLDSQGRIASIVAKVPAIGTAVPAADLSSTYSNWGAKVDAAPPPAAQTMEAPALVYTFLQ
jgi:hypothetical protein